MSKKYNNSEKEHYRIVIISNSIRIIEHVGQYSILGDMLLWVDFFDNNKKCYRLRAGEEVDVVTMSV